MADRISAALLALLLAAIASGCMFLDVKRQQDQSRLFVRFSGRVSLAEPAPGARVVVLMRMHSDGAEDGDVIDHYSRMRDGSFYFVASEPGRYVVIAFHDVNGDLNYDPDEPGIDFSNVDVFSLEPGDWQREIELVIRPDGRIPVDGAEDIVALQARSATEQIGASMGQLTSFGEVFELGDPRFGAESGAMGLWRPLDFIFEIRPGIFFAEPYDPDRIPVLFIHGMTGHPNEFEYLAERLDDSRFQPWFYFYPSGASLENVVIHLEQVVRRLESKLGLRRLFIVAHSMGGLIGKGLVFSYDEANRGDLMPLFVSISTPWGGNLAAQEGVDRAPAVVESWRDMAPDSRFQREILYEDPESKADPREWPEHVSHYLLFGYRGEGSLKASSDGVISIASQLLPAAQSRAGEVFGVDATHAGILKSPLTSEKLNRILATAARR